MLFRKGWRLLSLQTLLGSRHLALDEVFAGLRDRGLRNQSGKRSLQRMALILLLPAPKAADEDHCGRSLPARTREKAPKSVNFTQIPGGRGVRQSRVMNHTVYGQLILN